MIWMRMEGVRKQADGKKEKKATRVSKSDRRKEKQRFIKVKEVEIE